MDDSQDLWSFRKLAAILIERSGGRAGTRMF